MMGDLVRCGPGCTHDQYAVRFSEVGEVGRTTFRERVYSDLYGFTTERFACRHASVRRTAIGSFLSFWAAKLDTEAGPRITVRVAAADTLRWGGHSAGVVAAMRHVVSATDEAEGYEVVQVENPLNPHVSAPEEELSSEVRAELRSAIAPYIRRIGELEKTVAATRAIVGARLDEVAKTRANIDRVLASL